LDKEYSIYTMDLIPCFSDNKVWLWDTDYHVLSSLRIFAFVSYP
jgi:hypothetical protein